MSRLAFPWKRTPVITDGGWGTELQGRGLAFGESADLWNLTRPDDVEAVARSYVEAGSQIILTNTFQANPIALDRLDKADMAVEINREGVRISKRAVGSADVRVFASIGPTAVLMLGRGSRRDAENRATKAFTIQAQALAEGGADALLLETFTDLDEARLAVRAARSTGLPIVASFYFDGRSGELQTLTGSTPEEAARAMADEGADAVGANCGSGHDEFIAICRRLKAGSRLPVWIKPNAGLPMFEDGRLVYATSPAAFASCLPRLVEAGASFVGGCCGTGPEFIRALVAVRDQSPYNAPYL